MVLWSAAFFCGAQAMSLPSAKDILPVVSGYEEGKLFLLADTGFDTKPALSPIFPQPSGTQTQPSPQDSGKLLRVEMLALLPSVEGKPQTDVTESLRKIAFITNSVHSMAGIEYWSASRQRMRTLYAEAYRIDSPSGRAKLPDPVETALGPGPSWVFYAFLRDLTFGGNVLRYDVEMGPSYITMANENVASLKYMLIPLVPSGGMKSRILIIPSREGLIIHFLSTFKAMDIAAKRVFESAGNKSLAVLSWFAGETAAVGLTQGLRLPVNIEEVAKAK